MLLIGSVMFCRLRMYLSESTIILYQDKLIIGKFCSIACGAKFLFNSANHTLTSLSTYTFPLFFEEWELEKAKVTDAWDNKGNIVIGNDVWIGYEAVILSGVTIGDREIEVSLSEVEQVHIQYYENSKEYYDISVSDENVLTMTSASDKGWTDFSGVKPSDDNRKILLQIPDGLLENLTLSTTNENITLYTLAVAGNINLSSNGGNIAFENLDAGSALTLNAKNGNISGTIAGSYDDFSIQSSIKKGESNLPDNKEDGEKTLDVTGNNGDIQIEFTA